MSMIMRSALAAVAVLLAIATAVPAGAAPTPQNPIRLGDLDAAAPAPR